MVDSLPWDKAALAFRWRQGEHVTVVGYTGSGKTSLAMRLLERRRYVAAVATKPKDPNLSRLARRPGWKLVRDWPVNHHVHPRVVYWPRGAALGDSSAIRYQVRAMLENVWDTGGWSLFFDEIRYLSDRLALKSQLEDLWLQGRAMGISIVAATQRPFHIPLEAYSQASHLFLMRENDARNVQRLAEIGGRVDKTTIRNTVQTLADHEVLYVNTRTGAMFRTLPPPPGR